MKTEIKNVMEDLVTSVLNSVGDQIKGEITDTREEIIDAKLNIALLRIKNIVESKKTSILNIASKKGINVKTLSTILNDEL